MSDSLWPHGYSPGQNIGVGSLSLVQEIFPTEGSNPGLPHCRWILYQLSYEESFTYHYFYSKFLFWSVKSLGQLCAFWKLIVSFHSDSSSMTQWEWSVQWLLTIGSVFIHTVISNEAKNIYRLHYVMIVNDFKTCQVLLKEFYMK